MEFEEAFAQGDGLLFVAEGGVGGGDPVHGEFRDYGGDWDALALAVVGVEGWEGLVEEVAQGDDGGFAGSAAGVFDHLEQGVALALVEFHGWGLSFPAWFAGDVFGGDDLGVAAGLLHEREVRMRGRIERQVIAESERVDDPLLVSEVKTGLARSPQLEGVFIGMTFTGRVMGDGEGEYAGDLVLTVELVEVMIENLRKAVANAKREREQERGGAGHG